MCFSIDKMCCQRPLRACFGCTQATSLCDCSPPSLETEKNVCCHWFGQIIWYAGSQQAQHLTQYSGITSSSAPSVLCVDLEPHHMELLPVSWVTSHGLFSFSFSSSKPSAEVQNTLAKTLCNTPDILDLPSSQNQKSSTPNLMGWREESGQRMAIGVLCRPTSQVQTSWCQDRCNTNQRMARRCLCRVVSCPRLFCNQRTLR